MNLSNKSIITCETPPRARRRKSSANWENETPVIPMTFNSSPKTEQKKICCEHTSMSYLKKKTPRRKRKRKLCGTKFKNHTCEEVVVLSDEETDAKENSHESAGCPLLRRSLRLHNMTKCNEQRQNRATSGNGIGVIATNIATAAVTDVADTACLVVSDTDDNNTQDNVNNLNSANRDTEAVQGPDSNEASNDVVILWSSNNQLTASRRITRSADETNNRLYMVDVTPDPANLDCLTSNDEPLAKRRKTECGALVENLVQNGKYQRTRSKRQRCKVVPLQPKHASTDGNKREKNPYDLVNRSLKKSCATVQSGLLQAHPSVNENYNVHYLRNNVTTAAGTLREIIVDGSNIAMAYTNGKTFSEHGIKLVIDYFLQRGHSVKVFVPQYRRSSRHQYLEELYSEGIVVFTPSRQIAGKKIVPYDDRFILQYATIRQGVVVSCDQYRDLYTEKPEWRDTIEKRLLAPTFVDNYVMFPEDPLGRHGPKLDAFLRH